MLFSSCSKVIKTSQHAPVDAQVSSFPTVGDLHIAPQRVSKTVSWKWNPFNTTSLSARKENIKADLIKESGADILVEPEFVQHTSFCNLLGGSLTVSGYPATLDNFRSATPEDIAALRVAGMWKNNPTDNVYIVIDQKDINGVVVGKPMKGVSSVNAPESTTSSLDTVEDSPAVQSTEKVIPGNTVESATSEAAPSEVAKTGGRLENVSRLRGRHSNAKNPSRQSSSNRLAGDNAVVDNSSNSIDNITNSVQSSSKSLSEPIAYDRIGKDRYLVTMSREYYGDPNFWPYIYEENKAKLGHPDRITPGTGVLVPNLDKFGIDPKNPADKEKAKNLAKDIYARYGISK